MLLDHALRSMVSEPEELTGSTEPAREIDATKSPSMAALHQVCGELMILLGPMLWAALIVLFIEAEFFTK